MSWGCGFRLNHACKIFGVSRQAFYKPLSDQSDMHSITMSSLSNQAEIVRKRNPSRGCRAMYEDFGQLIPVGRDKSIGLLMDLGYRVKYPKRYGRATQSGTREFANLLVDRVVKGINQVWQADMAHYLYGNRKYYTIYITDVYTQEVVGYGAYSDNTAVNYCQVMRDAVKRCKSLTNGLAGMIHHSDGGKQYESDIYKQVCLKNGIQQSMCMYSYENPYAEKTNDLINNAYLNVWKPQSLKQLRECQRKAVKDHNQHSKKKVLQKLSPDQFKNLLLNAQNYNHKYELKLKPRTPEQPRKRQIVLTDY